MAATKIGRIRAAIASLGPDVTEEKASLEAALVRAEHLASIPPVDKRIADAEAFTVRAKKRIEAESAKIVEAEKQKQIFEQELAQAEKDDRLPTRGRDVGQWFRCSDRSCVCVGGRALASPRRAGSVEGDRTRSRSSMWTQHQFRIARRIVARRQHPCSGIERQVVGRSRAHVRDDRRDAQLSFLPPPWRAVRARYALRGERVGEASNPGPRLLWRYRRGMNSTRAVEISSEDEPLVPVRNVVPRLVGGETVATSLLETVLASQSDLATVGVQHSVDVPVVSNSPLVRKRVEPAPIRRNESADHDGPCSSIGIREGVLSTVPAQSPIPTWVDDADGSSSVSWDSCWGEMEDLDGEESADWGLLLGPAAPFQVLTDTVEGLEHDNVDLIGSHRHDQELCATRRDTDSVSGGLADQDSRGHQSVFSTLLDGLEEDLGVSTVVDLVSAPSLVPEVHREFVPLRSGRRVVLVPGSPDATPQSIQNRFAVLADGDPLTGEGHEELAVATRAE